MGQPLRHTIIRRSVRVANNNNRARHVAVRRLIVGKPSIVEIEVFGAFLAEIEAAANDNGLLGEAA